MQEGGEHHRRMNALQRGGREGGLFEGKPKGCAALATRAPSGTGVARDRMRAVCPHSLRARGCCCPPACLPYGI